MRRWSTLVVTVTWLACAGQAYAADPALPSPASSTVAITSAVPSSTITTDADRLASAEAELAALKRGRELAAARPKWWEYTCMGCISAVTILMIFVAMVL